MAIVDLADRERVMARRWSFGGKYPRTTEGGEHVSLHHFIAGAPEPGFEIDHENGERLDNRRCNLRTVTRAQNQQNRTRGFRGASKHRGVSKHGERWRAHATLNYKAHHIGVFDTEDEAAEAARAWRAEHMPYATN